MKNITQFILERSDIRESQNDTSSVTFNFTDLDNTEDTLKELQDKEYCTVDMDEKTATITVTDDNYNKLSEIQNILKTYSDSQRRSAKRSSNEQYAQKTLKFKKQVDKLTDMIDGFDNPEDNSDKKEEE